MRKIYLTVLVLGQPIIWIVVIAVCHWGDK